MKCVFTYLTSLCIERNFVFCHDMFFHNYMGTPQNKASLISYCEKHNDRQPQLLCSEASAVVLRPCFSQLHPEMIEYGRDTKTGALF